MTQPRERLLAIVAETMCEPGCGDAEGKMILTLWLLGVSDHYRGRKIRKCYFYEGEPSEALTRDFLTLGIRINSVEEIPTAAEQLVGRIVRLSFETDAEKRTRFWIDEYVGSDDPRKYYPQNDHKRE